MEADGNAARHGESAAARALHKAEAERSGRQLDLSRRDTDADGD